MSRKRLQNTTFGDYGVRRGSVEIEYRLWTGSLDGFTIAEICEKEKVIRRNHHAKEQYTKAAVRVREGEGDNHRLPHIQ